MTPRNPVLTSLPTYPFVRIDEAKAAAAARGIELIDFGMGEPREETPAFIRRALADAIEPLSAYPKAAGHAALREAIAAWVRRRFGTALDPATQVVPTLGSKEAIFSFAQVVGDVAGGRDLVAVTTPGYPVPARGALFAGLRVVEVPLTKSGGWLPDLAALGPATLDRLAVAWVNSPSNPTGAVVGRAQFEEYVALARRHGFVLASDEAYSEIYFGDPPASALQVSDLAGVVAFNTLSKRSAMPGYRSGFAAGDPSIIDALKRFRPNIGTAPQDFVQRASVVAWNDDDHVVAMRSVYAAKRELMLPALEAAGLRHAGGDGGFFLWLAVPAGGGSSEAYALELLERGIVVAPGAFLGAGGEGYVRLALVPPLEQCERAAGLIAGTRPPVTR